MSEQKQYHPDLEEDQKDDAVKCECCKIWDAYELMKSMPEGFYCIDCWEDIFN